MRSNRKFRAWPALNGSALALGVVLATPALAQATDAPVATPADVPSAAATAQADTSSGGAGEIVVTAQKREQSLNDVGITIAVLGADALKDRQVVSLQDLATAIPSISYTESAFNTPVFTIRGVGFYENSISAYPTVSLYVDEVPLSFPVTARHSAYDLQRVEVLKGPQGTLFGQNSTGGAINFIAAKPTNDFHAGLEASYGRFNSINLEGFVSGPLSEGIRARVAGRMERADGWQYSVSRPGDHNGKVNNYMGRLLVDLEPTERLRISLNLNGWKDKSETQAPQYISYYPQIPVFVPGVTDAPFTPEKPRAADWTPGLPFGDSSLWQASGRIDFDVTDDITLTTLSAYTDYKHHQASDQDGLPVSGTDVDDDSGRIKSFFQEVRLANGGGGGIRWIVGANYERSRTRQSISAIFPDASPAIAFGGFFPTFNINVYTDKERIRNYAGFGNVEVDLGQFTLKGGLRYTKSERSADICNVDPTPAGVGQAVALFLLGGANGPYIPGTCYSANDLGTTLGAVPPLTQGRFVSKLHEDNLSWRAGVDWKPSPDLLFYGNVSRGYKAGSFPTLASAVFSQYLPVTQESLLAYEAGVKATLLDRRLQLNAAAFYYDYEDKQIKAKVLDPVFGLLDVLQNIPKSRVKGAEFEATMRPTDGLVVGATFVYLDSKIKKYTGINGAGVAQNFAGTRIPYTPKYQVSVNGDYTWDVSSLKAVAGASLNFRSDTVAVIGGDINPPGATPSRGTLFGVRDYTTVDLRAGIGAPDDRWRVLFWGKNIFNEYYWTNVATTTDAVVRYAARPATYGATFSIRY